MACICQRCRITRDCLHEFAELLEDAWKTRPSAFTSDVPADVHVHAQSHYKAMVKRRTIALGFSMQAIARFLAKPSGFVSSASEHTMQELGISCDTQGALASQFCARIFLKTARMIHTHVTASSIVSLPLFSDAANIVRRKILLLNVIIAQYISTAPLQVMHPKNPSETHTVDKIQLLNEALDGESLVDVESGRRMNSQLRLPTEALIC